MGSESESRTRTRRRDHKAVGGFCVLASGKRWCITERAVDDVSGVGLFMTGGPMRCLIVKLPRAVAASASATCRRPVYRLQWQGCH